MKKAAPTFRGLMPKSSQTSRVARAASAKRDTKPELLLRKALSAKGLRYRVGVDSLPGKPDVVFHSARVVVFCDGDFWHGRNFKQRETKLAQGHNAGYWMSKIKANMARDRRVSRLLEKRGWKVIRCWEGEVVADPVLVADSVLEAVQRQPKRTRRRPSPHD